MFVATVAAVERLPQNELRRSARLQESGYYKADGRPVISYKETLYKVFKSRKGCRANSRGSSEAHRTKGEWPEYLTLLRLLLLGLVIFYGYHSCGLLRPQSSTFFAYSRLLSSEVDHLPNYALLSDGARVVVWKSSRTYRPASWGLWLQSWLFPKQPAVLQASSLLNPGKCWAFAGDNGQLQIQLSTSVRPSHITVGHIGQVQSPGGFIRSAPREFAVYGMKTKDGDETYLGTFMYLEDGPSFQTFALLQKEEVYNNIRLQVLNNWGNPDYTCIYNIRVHGQAELLPTGVAHS